MVTLVLLNFHPKCKLVCFCVRFCGACFLSSAHRKNDMYWWIVVGVFSPEMRCLNKNDRCFNTLRSFKMSWGKRGKNLSIAKSFKLASQDVFLFLFYRSLTARRVHRLCVETQWVGIPLHVPGMDKLPHATWRMNPMNNRNKTGGGSGLGSPGSDDATSSVHCRSPGFRHPDQLHWRFPRRKSSQRPTSPKSGAY